MRKQITLLYYVLIFVVTLFIPSYIYSQAPAWSWGKSIGSTFADYGNSVAVDASGNVYTTGAFSWVDADFDPGPAVFNLFSFNAEDIFISKLDANGDFVWAKAIGGLSNDNGNSIAVDDSGNVYVTGLFTGTVDFDPSGSSTFNITSNNFSNDIFVLKLNSSGNFVWAKAMGGPSNDYGFSIALDASGNVYTTGVFSGTADFDPGANSFNITTAGFNNIFISKLDNAGNFVWAKGMLGSTYCWGQSVNVDASGNVLVTGRFDGTVDFDPGAGTFNLTAAGGYDIFIAKLDNAGNFLWAKGIGGTSQDVGYSIAADALGNVYTCGEFFGTADFDPGAGTFNMTSAGSLDAFVVKLSNSGNFVWARALGGSIGDAAYSLALDGAGNVYVTGYYSGTADFDPGPNQFNLTAAGGNDIFVCKLDNAGNFGWVKDAGGAEHDVANSIALSGAGSAHLTGYFYSSSFTITSQLFNADTSVATNDIFIAKTDIVTGTGAENFNNEILISPNPAGNQIIINSSQLSGKHVLAIYDAFGQSVFNQQMDGKNAITIDVSEWKAGIYFAKLTGEREQWVNKIVVQH